MCGILYYDLAHVDGDVDTLVDVHASKLAHRGPDGSASTVVADTHLLCFHRLAIVAVDASAAMQPLRHATTGAALVCNGEIYNHRDLGGRVGEVDVAVLLDLLVKEGAEAATRLDGDFAFVFVDPRFKGGGVIAARDPLGVRPLFYGVDGASGRILAFASEAKALVKAPGIDRIFVFPPGHVYSHGMIRPYWTHVSRTPEYDLLPNVLPWDDSRAASSKQAIDRPTAIRRVRELLESAVEKRMMHSERPVALLCSGGIDSSVLLCTAVRIAERRRLPKPRVFTMRYGQGHSDDAFYASLLCADLGCELETVRFEPSEVNDATLLDVVRACETADSNTVRAALPMYLLAKHISAKTDVKVVLSGEGADELFGGYGYFRLAPGAAERADECERLLRNLHMFDLLRADRCFAAHGLEVRVPFLDEALVRTVVDFPPDVRFNSAGNLGEKQLLRDAFDDMEVLRRCRILDRPKERFSDGAGFSYVPDLLRHHASRDPERFGGNGGASAIDDGMLKNRLVAEKCANRAMFSAAFPPGCGAGSNMVGNGPWVVERRMPAWASYADDAKTAEGGAEATWCA